MRRREGERKQPVQTPRRSSLAPEKMGEEEGRGGQQPPCSLLEVLELL